MSKQCFSIMRTQNIICCCFRIRLSLSVFSLYDPLDISLNNFIPSFLTFFFVFVFVFFFFLPTVKVNTKETQLPKKKQQRHSIGTALIRLRLLRHWKLWRFQAAHSRSPRTLAAFSI